MESFLNFVEMHAQYAHWIFFCLILLSALNLPISEDTILIAAGAISALYVPQHTVRMIIWLLCAYVISGWVTYWIGRLLGPKLVQYRWFNKILTNERLRRIESHLNNYGLLTFMVIRFCPGGARNALFLTSGFIKMPFLTFMLRDGFALIFPFSLLFTLGYLFGANLDLVLHYFKVYSTIILSVIGFIGVSLLIYFFIVKPYFMKQDRDL